ncbi:hypothetical protein LSM04_004030 [Trypanosoma melophagium]|uniref:uncharacterized protein n=1 Tax=Trypanosoma melophagium TaxID=715481 RepID=UPI00351A95A1|nr:hypothetical protein LSM04_004030 [Trypanosoma melophagium]
MGFRLSFGLTLLFMLCDLTLLSVRVSVNSGTTVYVLLAVHEAVLLTLAFLFGSFIVHTRWVLVGPLSDATRLLRVVTPLWFLRIILTLLPNLYRIVILPQRRAWSDAGYGVLFILNIVFFITFSMALLHAICFLSEKTLYTPYYQNYPSRIPPSAIAAGVGSGSYAGASEYNCNPLERRNYDDAASHPCDVSSLAGMRTSHISDRQRSYVATTQDRRRVRY